MKKILFYSLAALAIFLFSSCNGVHRDAVNQAQQIQEAVKANTPGSIPTTDNGWTLTAKIEGKDWKATSIMPPDRAGRIVGENNGESISLPYYDRVNFLRSDKRKLGEGHDGVDVRLNDDVALWSAEKGQMELTKVDEKWAEGKFSFTAKGFQTDKTKEFTDGFFRISVSGK